MRQDANKIRRALISVSDKSGLAEFAKALYKLGVEIISTGGTSRLLKKSGLPVHEVSSITRFPEMLDGRVKTLHPALHAGLLALRDNPSHMKTLSQKKIKPIDLLVVNLYPFWEAVQTKKDSKEIIEMIDIGGPTMLRAAAKNYSFVAAVSDPRDYLALMSELKKNKGFLSDATRKGLAVKVFKHTSYYDGLIQRYLEGRTSEKNALPDRLTLDFE